MKPEPGPTPAAASPRLPEGAARLFGHYDPGEIDPRRAAPFLIGRLLEDGDGDDLRWLAGAYPEAELATWLARHGARALSRRSLAFWRTVLGDDSAAPEGESPGRGSRSSRASLPPGGAARTSELWPL